jgi:Tfp pilus assembly protein PilO
VDNVKFHEKEVTGRNLTELTLESSVTGDYNGIVRFLNDLQRSKHVYIVDGLDVDSQTSGQGPVGALRINLHMRTYFRKA